MLLSHWEMKNKRLLLFLFVLLNFNVQGQKIEAVDLSYIKLLEANKCYIQLLPQYEYSTTTREYLAPNFEYSLTEIEKHYKLKTEVTYKGGDTILNYIHPAEYEITYDTLKIRKSNKLNIIEVIKGDTISEFFEVLPSDTLLMQCSKCDDLRGYLLFNAFCKIIRPAQLILNRRLIKSTNQILSKEVFPKIIIISKYKMIKPPFAVYKYLPPIIMSTEIVAVAKTGKAPKNLVKIKRRIIRTQAKPYACFSGWTWKNFICSSCKPELIIYNNGKILELQKRLKELAYPIKLTNIVDKNLIQILNDMDLNALKNNALIRCAEQLIRDFERF